MLARPPRLRQALPRRLVHRLLVPQRAPEQRPVGQGAYEDGVLRPGWAVLATPDDLGQVLERAGALRPAVCPEENVERPEHLSRFFVTPVCHRPLGGDPEVLDVAADLVAGHEHPPVLECVAAFCEHPQVETGVPLSCTLPGFRLTGEPLRSVLPQELVELEAAELA